MLITHLENRTGTEYLEEFLIYLIKKKFLGV